MTLCHYLSPLGMYMPTIYREIDMLSIQLPIPPKSVIVFVVHQKQQQQQQRTNCLCALVPWITTVYHVKCIWLVAGLESSFRSPFPSPSSQLNSTNGAVTLFVRGRPLYRRSSSWICIKGFYWMISHFAYTRYHTRPTCLPSSSSSCPHNCILPCGDINNRPLLW